MNDSIKKNKDLLTTLTTIKDYIRWGASLFAEHKVFLGHGLPTYLDESIAVVLHCIHQPFDLPEFYWDTVLTDDERKKVMKMIIRRIKERKPVAYLTHEALFAGLNFYVDERVLVPRSPIGEIIQQQFDPWVDKDQVFRILDLCTGSGCIACACAYAFPYAQVDAVDLSDDALAVARININKHDLGHQVNLIKSDLFNEVPDIQYDVIVTNPPYVSIHEWRTLPPEYHKEPEMGFTAGVSGLDHVLRILLEAKKYLSERGILIVEVGSSAESLQQLFPVLSFYWLDFERGGDGVFLLTAEQVNQYYKHIEHYLTCQATQ